MKPLAIDLFCGLGGWAEGFLAEGYDVVGFDTERHDYGTGCYPAQLVLQDVLTLHGSQFRNAAVIVASPPCQAYSYRAMPWKRARDLPPPSNELFEACFRIQREASEAAGRYIPLVVENVCGAQKWVGRARWHFGSYYLWGDVPALMPPIHVIKAGHPERSYRNGHVSTAHLTNKAEHGRKVPGIKLSEVGFNVAAAQRYREGIKDKDSDGYERNHPQAFGWKAPRTNSKSDSRKAASAQIAKIPFPLAQHIARVYRPEQAATA